jgi:2-polyprenyl-3-methyl-5-hydroxy-6-metoxy-1,4-benzoquinol methylase
MDLQQLYSSRLYWHIVQNCHGYPPIEQRADLYKRDGRLDYWLELIQRYGPPQGTVIEVGCAPGILLAELQAKGYKCIGVEPDEETANWIRQNMRVNVRAGLFPGVELPNCELFLAFDVIEHSPNPDQFMQEVARLLNPGGIAIIQTPIERYGYDPPFGEAFRSAFKEYEHLFLFANKAIEMLAERSGLEIIAADERLWLHHEVCVFRRL